MVKTTDPSYALALRPRITFKSLDGATTYFTYDSFSGSNPITVTALEVEGATGESGFFNLTIADPDDLVDQSGIRSCQVFIELGKKSEWYQYFMIGPALIFNISRPVSRYKEYQITGFGDAIKASWLFIHRRETYKRTEQDAKVYQIIENALTKRTWRPLKKADESIEDLTGWDPSGISTKVKTPYTVVDAALVYFNDFLDQLCAITGAVWFIDFTGGNKTFTLTYNTDLHTGITIKSGDLKAVTDEATKNSYIKKAFAIEDNATTEAGIATRLISTQIIDKEQIYEQKIGTGRTTLVSRAIAQQIVIDNDSRRIESIEFGLDKIGDPSSPKDRVNGDIVLDVNNQPTGTVLDTFSIPLSQIKSGFEFVEVSDIDISEKKLSAGQTKIWLRLFQRSGIDGDPNTDSNNTVAWHHNNIFNTTQSLYSGTSTNKKGDNDLKSQFTWNITNQGPLYAVRINSNIRRLFSRTNRQAVNTLGLRELFIPTDFIKDPQSVGQYMSLNLSQMSKPRRAIQGFKVTLPNEFIFKPYHIVTFHDNLSGVSQDLQVKRVRYLFGSTVEDPQVGTLSADLTLGGSYNPLLLTCGCS